MSGETTSVPIESLLRHRDWMRGFARALVYGDQDAEDIEQEAWLAALEAPPSRETSPRGWLATVIRRTAARLGRRDQTRRENERRTGQAPEGPVTADVVMKAEIHERVVRTVLGLAEPYRETILLRFYEDLALRDVATRMSAPLETVRSRLRRGLEILRLKLEERDPDAWRSMLLPLIGTPAAKAGLWVAVAAGVVAFVGISASVWMVVTDRLPSWRGRAAAAPPAVRPVAADEVASGAGPQKGGDATILGVPFPKHDELEQGAPAAPGSSAVLASPVGRLEVQILESDGRPAVGRRFDLFVNTGAKSEGEIREEEEVLSFLQRDIAGPMAEQAGVTLAEMTPDAGGFVRREVKAGVPGRLRVCVTLAESGVRAREDMGWLVRYPFDPLVEGETRRLPPITLPQIPLLVAGRVEDQDGAGLADILVRAFIAGEDSENPELTRNAHRLAARTDAAGRFRIEAATPATEFLAWARLPAELGSPFVPFKAGEGNVVLRAGLEGGIRGRIRSATSDTPVLVLKPEGLPKFHDPGQWSLGRVPGLNPDGSFGFHDVAAGAYTLEIWIGIVRARSFPGVVIEPGKTNADPRFADLIIGDDLRRELITVVDEDGRPIPRARVLYFPTSPGGRVEGSMTQHTDEKGELSAALPDGASMSVAVERTGYLPWERASVTFPLQVTLLRGATVIVRLGGLETIPKIEGIQRYWLCLIPEASAPKNGIGAIPKSLRKSQAVAVTLTEHSLEFLGTAPDRYVVFLFPDRDVIHHGSSDHEQFSGGDALELGTIDVKRSGSSEATYTVDTGRLSELINR